LSIIDSGCRCAVSVTDGVVQAQIPLVVVRQRHHELRAGRQRRLVDRAGCNDHRRREAGVVVGLDVDLVRLIARGNVCGDIDRDDHAERFARADVAIDAEIDEVRAGARRSERLRVGELELCIEKHVRDSFTKRSLRC
jgi:hypothetical protein